MIDSTEIEILNKQGKSVKIVDCGDENDFDTFGVDQMSDLAESPSKRRARRNDSKKKDATSLGGR